MSGHFIYVFNSEDRDNMVKSGFHLLKSDEKNNVFVFILTDEDKRIHDYSKSNFIISDILTF